MCLNNYIYIKLLILRTTSTRHTFHFVVTLLPSRVVSSCSPATWRDPTCHWVDLAVASAPTSAHSRPPSCPEISTNKHKLNTLVVVAMNKHKLNTLVVVAMNKHKLNMLVVVAMNYIRLGKQNMSIYSPVPGRKEMFYLTTCSSLYLFTSDV